MTYLIEYCSGEAREVIENCCVLESKQGYDRARKILRHQFGRPYMVARAHINQLAKGQSIRPSGSAALQSLSCQMLKCGLTLFKTGFEKRFEQFRNSVRNYGSLATILTKKMDGARRDDLLFLTLPPSFNRAQVPQIICLVSF